MRQKHKSTPFREEFRNESLGLTVVFNLVPKEGCNEMSYKIIIVAERDDRGPIDEQDMEYINSKLEWLKGGNKP